MKHNVELDQWDKEQGNKLIYEFLHPDSNVKNYYIGQTYLHFCWRKGYHKNWSTLIPLAKRILNLKLDISSNILKQADLQLSISRLDITEVYISICNYLEWYNKNNK